MPRPVLLLHLSDPNFGPDGRFGGLDTQLLGQRFAQALQEELRLWSVDLPVSAVLATGDITIGARPPEYAQAKAFFRALAEGLRLDRQRVILCPGNRDVSWAACKRVELDQEEWGFDEQELKRRVEAARFGPFDRFLEELSGLPSAEHGQALGAGRLWSMPDLQLSVAMLNSSTRESHREHGGCVDSAQLQALRQAWSAGPAKGWLKVIGLHHPPLALTPPEVAAQADAASCLRPELLTQLRADTSVMQGWESLRELCQELGVQLLLHGHGRPKDLQSWPWLGPQRGATQVMPAGAWLDGPYTLASLPGTLQLLLLDPGHQEIRQRQLRYEPDFAAANRTFRGRLALDPQRPEGLTLPLTPPQGFTSVPPTEPGDGQREFLTQWRRRLNNLYTRWDMGAALSPQSGAPTVEANLDEMYLPLRAAPGYDLRHPERGVTVTPQDLLTRERPLVLRGGPGAGKTSWARWTFRQLLLHPGAFPLMLELRRLARRWCDPDIVGEKRSVDWFLEDWIAEHLGGRWRGALASILEDNNAPLPVLIVDGWDELGELGEEFRGKLLGFLQSNPRLRVVVTSRPYGRGRPAESDGFEVLDIQPLSESEVHAFAWRFHERCFGPDEHAVADAQDRFLSALERAPEAQGLSRSPLMLTMMLLISRSRPLPDLRHKLYQACIETLLHALPSRRQEEGVLALREHWRPDEPDQRLHAAAALAWALQSSAYRGELYAPVVRSWDELARLLPEDWPRSRRVGFLAWLSGAAGILVDRGDGTLAFTHLSIQEFLTACHLHTLIEGAEERVTMALDHLRDEDWWETLRLWAALVQSTSPTRLEPVLRALVERGEEKGLSLAGCMYADGLGEERWFLDWTRSFCARMGGTWPRAAAITAQAWASSRQEERRRHLTRTLEEHATRAHWLAWLRAEEWVLDAHLQDELQRPAKGSLSHTMIEVIAGNSNGAGALSVGRLLAWGCPLWPAEPSEVALLHVWPNRRRALGMRLQLLATFGADPPTLREVAPRLIERPELDADMAQWSQTWRDRWTEVVRQYWDGELDEHWATHLAEEWARDLARNLTLGLPGRTNRRWAAEWAAGLPQRLLDRLGLTQAPVWAQELGKVLLFSLRRQDVEEMLVSLYTLRRTPDLISTALRARRGQGDHQELEVKLKAWGTQRDPLWPALARHLCGRSSEADRSLLNTLALQPEQRPDPLAQGLRWIVRGDVALEGGAVLTLEELGLNLPGLE